ncbi:MAG: hypothetical protein WAO76_02115 [Georgfuchsia sp.]
MASLFLATALALLTGCGGSGGGGSDGGTGGETPTSTIGAVQLLVSSQQMPSSATATTTLTAVVVDSNRQAMAGQTVSFSTTDSSATISNPNPVTSASGTVSATLNIGSTSRANRVITVTAKVGSVSDSNTVSVTGTAITINGNTSLAGGTVGTYTITVKDSTGVALQGVTLAVNSQNNNPVVLTPSTGITDSSGQIAAAVTATNSGSGTDVLTVTGAGASQTQTITINTTNFAFATVNGDPITDTPEIVVGTTSIPITVDWSNSGTAVPGTVIFSATRGVFSPTSVATSAGVASTSVTSSSTGDAIFTAKGIGSGDPSTSLNVVFITTSASSINTQAFPSTVETNLAGSKTSQSVIKVVVRDAQNNLVKNAVVDFSLNDSSGGSLDYGTATTDVTGTASVNYIAGTTSSESNGVEISATASSIIVNGTPVVIAPITSTVKLTVAAQALFVRLGTNNVISSSGDTYSITYSALVTNIAGNPVPDDTPVTFLLRPTSEGIAFIKGAYEPGWVLDIDNVPPTYGTITGCPREDWLYNGVVCSASVTSDCNPDTNGNGVLDPNGVATVNTTAKTSNGIAVANITYLQNYATWAVLDLIATAGTSGNDPPATATFTLPAPASALSNPVPPPFVVSPYGQGATGPVDNNAVCTNAL